MGGRIWWPGGGGADGGAVFWAPGGGGADGDAVFGVPDGVPKWGPKGTPFVGPFRS